MQTVRVCMIGRLSYIGPKNCVTGSGISALSPRKLGVQIFPPHDRKPAKYDAVLAEAVSSNPGAVSAVDKVDTS